MKAVSENLKGFLQVTVMPSLVTMNQFQGLNANNLHWLEDVPPRYIDACPCQRAWFDYGEVLYGGFALRVVSEPLESISPDLGFNGNSLAEGLVVTTCLGGAFLGSIVSGSITDVVGCRKGFQTESLEGILLRRFLVGASMGLGPSVASVVRYLKLFRFITIIYLEQSLRSWPIAQNCE
ncbi:hypothetical protein MKX03_023636 [Papaver bracteatum]|nr:hypothetical protein MKX03_023636 [Papaver bracteatum]